MEVTEHFIDIFIVNPLEFTDSLFKIHLNEDRLSSPQEYALSPRDLQHHAHGQNGSCGQTGESLITFSS